MADRIIRLSPSDSEKLHYRCLKAVGYLVAGDLPGAETELRTALDTYEGTREQTSESMYAKNSYARALDLLGRLSNKTELLGRSMEVWEEMLRSDRLSPLGYADIYRELGDSLKYKQEWRAALAAYTKAFEFQPRPVLWVFIAECEMNIDGPAAAVTRLKTINAAGLDVSEYVDYVFTYAVIATTSGNEELLSCVEKLLRELSISEPFFQKQRHAFLISVIDIQRFGALSSKVSGRKTNLRNMASTLLKYIKLEPNIMGVGLNVGKMIDDFSNREETEARKIP